MKNAGPHGRAGGGVQREKAQMGRIDAEEDVWAWDRPQLTRAQNREQRGNGIPNAGASQAEEEQGTCGLKRIPRRGLRAGEMWSREWRQMLGLTSPGGEPRPMGLYGPGVGWQEGLGSDLSGEVMSLW